MAKQEQFQKSARSPGFQPIQVSGRDIANMRSESARVVEGMRRARQSEIDERERQQRARLENQRLEASDRERNLKILTQNAATEREQLRLDSQQKLQQLQANQKASAEIFKSVADFSKTALTQLQKMDEARFEEERVRAFELARSGQYEDVVAQVKGEQELQATEQERRALIDEGVASGTIDPLAASQLKSMSSGTRLGLEQGRGVYMLTTVYEQKLQKALAENPGLGAEETAAFVTRFYRDFLRDPENGINGKPLINLKPELLRVGTESVQKLHQGIQTAARKREAKDLADQRYDDAKTILTQNPAQFNDNISTSFQTWKSDFGNKVALQTYESLATMRKPNGEFMFTMEQLAAADLKGTGKAFADEWPSRIAAMKEARLTADNKQRQALVTAENISYKEAELNALETLSEDNSKAAVDQAVEFFKDTYGKVPQSIIKFQSSYTIEAEAKAKQIEKLEAIPDGFLTQEAVDAMSYLDPTKGREMSQRFALQEQRYNKGVYKQQSDSFKTVANGVTSFGSQKPNTPSSLFLQQQMRAEYRRRVDQAVAGGADFNTAANTIAMQLAEEVKVGARDENSMWFRKVSKPGGAADFPNLNTGNLSSVEQARRNYAALRKSVADNGMEKTLDTAESIITKEEAVIISQNYGKPGFVIPTDVLAVAALGNGTDPFTIINRQLRALKMTELVPPQITQDVNTELSPELRKQLYSDIAGPRQKLRALETGSVRQTGTVNRFQRPGTMRPMFKRSFTGAMTYEDNSQEYVTTGKFFESIGFQVREHPDFGGTAPVHAGNSYHGYGEAFDITHQTGEYSASIEKTRQLKEAIRSLGLFEEIIGPGDGDPNHETHLHLGGLMRPMTPEDIEKLNSLLN